MRWPNLSATTLTHSQALLIAALLHAHRPMIDRDDLGMETDAATLQSLEQARNLTATWDDLARALGVDLSTAPPESLTSLEHKAAWEPLAAEGVGETALCVMTLLPLLMYAV